MFFGDKLDQVVELINYKKLSNLVLINDHKATEQDFENFIVRVIRQDIDYMLFFNDGILELNTNV